VTPQAVSRRGVQASSLVRPNQAAGLRDSVIHARPAGLVGGVEGIWQQPECRYAGAACGASRFTFARRLLRAVSSLFA